MLSVTNTTAIVAIIGAVLILVVLFGSSFVVRRSRRNTKLANFKPRWQEVQKLCAKQDTWPMAIINADKLLDEALKLSGIKGKTMGERLVAAQRMLSDNDGVWFGHKLRNKLVHEDTPKLQKTDVQTALKGLRQALMDLGVL
jgi:hypothetical protein